MPQRQAEGLDPNRELSVDIVLSSADFNNGAQSPSHHAAPWGDRTNGTNSNTGDEAQIGMPAINDFSEKRTVKDLYELRDKPFPTHAYIVNEINGCLLYLGPAIGYGLPYATQYTSPTRIVDRYVHGGYIRDNVPQAEPNGLFMPTSAEGTWIMLKAPGEEKVQPVYVEPRVLVSPFRLPDLECTKKSPAETPSAPKK